MAFQNKTGQYHRVAFDESYVKGGKVWVKVITYANAEAREKEKEVQSKLVGHMEEINSKLAHYYNEWSIWTTKYGVSYSPLCSFSKLNYPKLAELKHKLDSLHNQRNYLGGRVEEKPEGIPEWYEQVYTTELVLYCGEYVDEKVSHEQFYEWAKAKFEGELYAV